MKINLTAKLMVLMIVAEFVLLMMVYPRLPEVMVTHWGLYGEPNGYMNKFWGVMIFPVISMVMFLMYFFIPMTEPKKENLKDFRKEYDRLMFWIFGFLNYIFLLSVLFNLGVAFEMGKMVMFGLGVFFVALGLLLPRLKQNYMVGIKTPWTLADETTWKKTHILGGKLYIIAGGLSILGALLPTNWGFFISIGSIILASLTMMIYSYGVYRLKMTK